MAQVQFFLFGLFLIWFTGSGKLRALIDALRNEPKSGGLDLTTPPEWIMPITGPTGPIDPNA